jgi:hypothetical protein
MRVFIDWHDRHLIRCIIATMRTGRGITREAYALLPYTTQLNTPSKEIREEIHPNHQILPQRPLLHAFIYHAPNALAFIRPLKEEGSTHPSISNLPNGPEFNPIPNPHPPKLQPKYSPFGINALPRSRDPKRKTT